MHGMRCLVLARDPTGLCCIGACKQQAISLRGTMTTEEGESWVSYVIRSCVNPVESVLAVREGIQNERHLQEEVC